ncbi:MAG TPA: RNA pseudouridine synthase [Bacillota bacterium]|nr:RNA pseudouridine synthase [Bacillota bacterium]
MEIPILYEDNHLLVVEKPVNIPVQADRSKDKDLLTLLKEDLKVRYQKPGNVFLGLVHRLDRPVGGVMVFAKTSKCASRLSDSIRRGKFERTYIAVVRGLVPRKRGTLEHFLYKDKRKNKVYVVGAHHKQGKKAILDYEVLGKEKNLSKVSVYLHTGRPHQIRVQLAALGFPIYGDQKYGAHVNKPGQQIALWAHTLLFQHPTKKDIIEVTAPISSDYPWLLFESKGD